MVALHHIKLALILSIGTVPAVARPDHTKSSIQSSSVTIEKNGALAHVVSGNETAATCASFRLTAADVREFFARAKRVSAMTYGHQLDASNCVVTGTAIMTNGVSGRWTIDLERRGEILLVDRTRQYYYCATCSSRLYDEVDTDKAP